nr:hypothetical protein [uncultured Fusobacterium sp.]
MKCMIVIKSNDLSKGNHILLSKDEIVEVDLNTLSYDSLSTEPLTEHFNEYYKTEKKDTVRYEAEPELIIVGKIFNNYHEEFQSDIESRYMTEQLKNYITNKFGNNFNLKDKERLLVENILLLNRENVKEFSKWEYKRNYDEGKDYRDIVLEFISTEGDSIIVYLDKMYIYDYFEEQDIEKGYGEYKIILRKNPIIKENVEVN